MTKQRHLHLDLKGISKLLNAINKQLDHITMYRLTLYFLISLIVAAFVLSLVGDLNFSASSIAITTIILVIACYFINKAFAYIFDAPTNIESSLITALILALIITPATNATFENYTVLLAAAGLAIASKYILTYKQKHIFNPAALAVVLTGFGPRQGASWWIGTSVMLPFVIIGGILLILKIKRTRMVLTFFVTALASTSVYTLIGHGSLLPILSGTITTSAMFFLGFVMLTEPLTTPPTAKLQTLYAILVGLLFPTEFHIFSLHFIPELALITANFVFFIVRPRAKLFPTLEQKVRLTPDSLDFIFNPNRKLAYQPGQYMEWTLPHSNADRRGIRRYFTLASSPTEENVRIGVKFYDQGSTYKQAMLKMTPESWVVADNIAGDFTLPRNKKQKIVFIAGGIGITPYRSMIKYLIDKNEARDIVLLYAANSSADFAYTKVFEQARRLGINTIYLVSEGQGINNGHVRRARISDSLIKAEVPDYMDRLFYVSGSQVFVSNAQGILKDLQVPRKQIKTDDFSGYN
ncbi:MAG: FAD-dependent oxidoreductase [Candidatus Saccharimonadales bacterium]